MARRKLSPEAQIIALFTGLTDEGKRMVMFGLEAIRSVESPKSPALVVAKKSARKGAAPSSTANTEGEAESASGVLCVAKVPGLDVECSQREDALIHDPKGGYASFHKFEAPKVKKAAK